MVKRHRARSRIHRANSLSAPRVFIRTSSPVGNVLRILSIETLALDGERGRGNTADVLGVRVVDLDRSRTRANLERTDYSYRAAIAGYVAITDDTWPIVWSAVDLREHSADPDLAAAG